MGFELLSGETSSSDDDSVVEKTPTIDEDELTDAVSDLIDEAAEEENQPPDDEGKVKSWRVRLKSGLILSFPSLIVVQGWAADKDTSTIGLARGDGEFKPYEQVLGMMQTIETKAINPDEIARTEEEEEIVDGLGAAARAAAQRRRDGKMENITAEYQFRKDVFKKQTSSSPKKLFVVIGLLVVLAGAAVALGFLGIVDLGLGFAPAPPSAPTTAIPTKEKGPRFKVLGESKEKTAPAKKTSSVSAAAVCKALEKAGVAKKGSCVKAKPEKISALAQIKYDFLLENLAKEVGSGQVLEFGDKKSFEKTVKTFEAMAAVAGPHRYQSDAALIFVQLNKKTPAGDAKKAKSIVEALGKTPKTDKKKKKPAGKTKPVKKKKKAAKSKTGKKKAPTKTSPKKK